MIGSDSALASFFKSSAHSYIRVPSLFLKKNCLTFSIPKLEYNISLGHLISPEIKKNKKQSNQHHMIKIAKSQQVSFIVTIITSAYMKNATYTKIYLIQEIEINLP